MGIADFIILGVWESGCLDMSIGIGVWGGVLFPVFGFFSGALFYSQS